MNTDRTRTYPENPLGGADFVAGDVHGCFRTLKRAIEAVDFDPERDRLFAVGDLVNRGPHSHEAIDWLSRSGRILCSARGNHDALTLKRFLYRWQARADTTRSWLDLVPVEETMRWIAALRRLPSVITVETPHGPVGVVHAAPARHTWKHTLRALKSGNAQATEIAMLGPDPADPGPETIPDLRLLIHGHWPHPDPRRRGNRWNVDTGAGIVSMNRLTLARIDVDPIELHTFDVEEGSAPGEPDGPVSRIERHMTELADAMDKSVR